MLVFYGKHYSLSHVFTKSTKRYLKLLIFLSKWNYSAITHRILNKPLPTTTDISSAQRKGPQQTRQHEPHRPHANPVRFLRLSHRSQNTTQRRHKGHKSQQTTDRAADWRLWKYQSTQQYGHMAGPTGRGSPLFAGCPFAAPHGDFAPSERDWSLIRHRTLWKMGKRSWSPKHWVFLLIN